MKKLLPGVAVLAFMAAAPAYAQVGPIDRNRPDRAPPGAQAPTPAAPPRGGQVAAPARPPFTPFVLTQVQVSGSSIPPALVGGASRPFVGRTIDEETLKAITDAVAAAYATTDIALYTVIAPEQDFAGGVLRIVVVEGYIENVAMHVDGGRDLSLIRSYATKLTAERPLRRSTLERYLSLIRDIPGLTVQAELQGGNSPGAVRLALEAKQKRVGIGLGVSTRGTSYLGRTQVTGDATFYGLFRQGDRSQFTVTVPTDLSRFQYYAFAHQQPLNAEGTTATLNLAYLRTRPKGINLKGDAKVAGIQVTHPLIRSYNRNLYLTGSLDGLNSENALLGQVVSDERTRAFRAAAAYGRTGEKISYSLSGSLSLGLDGLGARTLDPRLSETGFRKVNGQFALDGVLTPQLVARLRASGQYSGDRLPASEMFALGGDAYGRAFQASSVTGDRGYAGSLELAFVPKAAPAMLKGSEVYGFVDGGKTWVKGRLGFPTRGYSLASAGGGVRALIAARHVIEVEAARSIDEPFPLASRDTRVVVNYRARF